MRQQVAVCVALLSLGLAGCGSGTSPGDRSFGCTASVEPALVVLVTDAATGAPAAEGATVVATDDAFTEILAVSRFDGDTNGNLIPTGFSGAAERAGTYTVQVTRPGYAAATRTGIRATQGDCHVSTQTVTVALTPQ